jgi:HD-GYP domain-containing protein (c-di-GMP phosphodiesterase class II)
LIARAVGVPEHRTRQLIAGTLLQDLGLIYLPTDMPAEERLRLHPLLGHRLLREMKYVEALAAHVALEHHEFTDGTGQPRGVIGQNALSVSRWSLPPLPTLIGEIAAVANVYAQLAGKGRREAVTPDAAIAELRKQAGVKLNKAIVSEFLRATPIFPAGTRVIVRGGARDGFRGRVNSINETRLDRPVVILERDSKNKEIEPCSMDLMQDKKSRLETRPW